MSETRRRPHTARAMAPARVAMVILIIGVLNTYPAQVAATCTARHTDGTCVCRPSSGNLMMMDKDGGMGVVTLEVGMKTALVCVSNMNEAMADVVCKQFGYKQKVGFGTVHNSTVDTSVDKYTTYGHCHGYEECLEECEGHFWHLARKLDRNGETGPCYEANERAIICSDEPDPYAEVRPTQKVLERDPILNPETQLPEGSPPADQPIVNPTGASEESGAHDQPVFPIIDYDMLPPADAPMPTTTSAPVTDPPRPQATGQPPRPMSPSELTPHESVLLPSSASPHNYPSASSKGLLRLLTSAIKAISTSPIPPTFSTTPFFTIAGRDPTSKILHKELVVIEESSFDLHPVFDDSDISKAKSRSYYSERKSRFLAKLGLWPTTTSLLNMGKMKVIPALKLGNDKLKQKENVPTIASTPSSAPHSSTLAFNLNHASSSGSTSDPNSFTSSSTIISLPQSTPPTTSSGLSRDLDNEADIWFGVRNATGAGSEGIASLDRRLDPDMEETPGSSGEGSTVSKAFGTATSADAEATSDYLTSATPSTPINKFRFSGRFVSKLERTTLEPNTHSSTGSSDQSETPSTTTVPRTISVAGSTIMDFLETQMPHSTAASGESISESLSTPTTTESSESVKLPLSISPTDTESARATFTSTITPSPPGATTNHTTNAFTKTYTHSITAIITTISQTLSHTSNSTRTGVGQSVELPQTKSNVSFPGNTTQSQTIHPSTHILTSNDQSTITNIPNHEIDSTTSGTTTPGIQQVSTSTPSESTEYVGFGSTQSVGPHSTVITEHSISVLASSTKVVSSTGHSIPTANSLLRDDSLSSTLSPSSGNTSPLPSITPRVSIMSEPTAKGSTKMLFSSTRANAIDTTTSLDGLASSSASQATQRDSSKASDTVSPTVVPQGSQSVPPVPTPKPTSSQSTGASDSQFTAPPTLSIKALGDPTKGSDALSTSTKEEVRTSISSPEIQKTTSKALVDNLKNPPTWSEEMTSPAPSGTSHSLWSTNPGTLAETEAGGQRSEECEKALTSTELTSPGFPGPYPSDMSCGWNITVSQREKIVFSIYEFRTAEPDALSIYVGSREGELIEGLSGTVKAPTRRTKRAVRTIDTGVSSVFVVFTSDGDTTESGFRMGYKPKQKNSPGVDNGAATGPEKKKDGSENRNIIIIVVVVIIVVLLVVLLICCKCKCCKKNGEKVVIYDGFGSKTRIVPYESTEEKSKSGSWMDPPSERDTGFHMDEADERPPPPVELQSSSTSGHRGQHTHEDKVKDKGQEVWRSPESGQIGAEVVGRRRSTPAEDVHVENLTTQAAEVEEDDWVVRDSILMMGENRPKQPGPKTEGPLDTTIHKKTPPGQEETRIGGGRDLSHLYHAGPRDTSPRENSSRRPELLVSVPYAASMYTSRGQAIQMRAARGDPGDPVSGNSMSRAGPGVGHTSSILAANAKQGTKLPPLRTARTPTPTGSSSATDEQKMAAASKVRTTGSRPSSSGSTGSRASSAGSQRSNTTYTSGRRTSGSGSPPLTSAPPAEFVCPLTREVMKHPVVFEDGHIYEKSAIQAWCETHNVSPTTNAPITHGRTRSANEIRQRIREWKKARMQVLITAAQGTHGEPEQLGNVDT